MRRCVLRFVPRDKRLVAVDFGSRTSEHCLRQGMTHRQLLAGYDCDVIGVDVIPGPNVDVVMEQPYRLPFKSRSVDVVLTGQVFEHIPFFWASMMEIARVLKRDGLLLMTVPSRGHPHTPVDCWRPYPDGLRAMAAFSGLEIRVARSDFPPRTEGRRHRYELIDASEHYWGDTVGVFQKPANYPRLRAAIVRRPLLWWANWSAESFVSSRQASALHRRARTPAS
jgi:SAM-dependent methyltransferase